MGIELSREEIDAYLLAAPRGILCVNREQQAPLALPMWFGWIDGKILMTTLLNTKKVTALRKNPQVSFLVESGEMYFTLKAVLITGHCEIAEDHEGAAKWIEKIHSNKPLYKELFSEALPPHLLRHYELPQAVLTIAPANITSWDFANVRR